MRILSALASLMPLIMQIVFLGVKATASTVFRPASASFFVSDEEMPASCGAAGGEVAESAAGTARKRGERGEWVR